MLNNILYLSSEVAKNLNKCRLPYKVIDISEDDWESAYGNSEKIQKHGDVTEDNFNRNQVSSITQGYNKKELRTSTL